VRTEGGLDRELVRSGEWQDRGVRGNPMSTLEVRMENGKRKIVIHSFSGSERNKVFINSDGKSFEDVSTYSGADSVADSRCCAYWDYNHDGAIDVALINSNKPHIQIFRNQIPSRIGKTGGFVVIRLVGGNHEPQRSPNWSNRNGVGSRVAVEAGGKQLIREVRSGDGFSVQNSAQVIVGIGETDNADSIAIKWPSGRSQIAKNVKSGSRITFYENRDHSPDANGFEIEEYLPAKQKKIARNQSKGLFHFDVPGSAEDTKIRVFINMATWCEACREEMPEVQRLMSMIDDRSAVFVGVPIDPADTREKLNEYSKQFNPPYPIVTDLEIMYRKGLSGYLRQQLGSDALPNTIITDNYGNPLHVQFGLPTVSEIRRLVESLSSPAH